jgi:hypothetical protein
MTGIGPVAVCCPRVRDRIGQGSERIRFSSAILPPYARRSKSLKVLIPILQVLVKALVPQAAVEVLHEAILHRFAGCDVVPFDGMLLLPGQDRV